LQKQKGYTINGTELLRTFKESSSHDEPAIRTMKYKQVKPKTNDRRIQRNEQVRTKNSRTGSCGDEDRLDSGLHSSGGGTLLENDRQ
jgi:hypothetical protein